LELSLCLDDRWIGSFRDVWKGRIEAGTGLFAGGVALGPALFGVALIGAETVAHILP
jgi:hypothetical protein